MWNVLLGVGATLLGGVTTLILLLLWIYPWLKYDYLTIVAFMKGVSKVMSNVRRRRLLIDEFEEKVIKHPKKAFLIYEEQEYTYEYMNKQMNKVAHAARKMGLQRGDDVAMLMMNEPAFVWTYLGLAKIGVQTVFLNFNLRSKSLLHCFNVCGAKVVIVGEQKELVEAVEEIYPNLKNDETSVYIWGNHQSLHDEFISLEKIFQESSSEQIESSIRSDISFQDTLCYIFTSGTTGLPKAAIITHLKAMRAAALLKIGGVNGDDIIYNPLPLYHTACGLAGIGFAILEGATLVLRKKFSATYFFQDCTRHNVTVIQYIGELCRYLLATPASTYDRSHSIRLAFGNGLRKDIWNDFKQRFNISLIYEFYGATEGNTGFINVLNKPGAVGRASPLLSKLGQNYFVKYNYETAEPLRDENGFCIKSSSDEAALMITPIKKNLEFDGYRGSGDLSEKKILRDVFCKGDIYFNSGDLFVRDKDYFVYFVDRIGDTFRWKGENVSTVEVANQICGLNWIGDACVYGVEIPGNDGKAGMAAITLGQDQEVTRDKLAELFLHCSKALPSYALPRFLRIQAAIEITTTFKQCKINLVREGFDPTKAKDSSIYCVDFPNKTYTAVTGGLYKDIIQGNLRL